MEGIDQKYLDMHDDNIESVTKVKVDDATLKKLFESAGLTNVRDISPLGAGEFNAVFGARADEGEYVIKIAPVVDVMTLEQGMMQAEVHWYEVMRTQTSVRVPQVIHTDFSKTLFPSEFFVMEKLPGKQVDLAGLTDEERRESHLEMVRMLAQLHRVHNDTFGYIQNSQHPTWYEAIRTMTQNILDDAAAKGQTSPQGEKLLALIDRYKEILEKAECYLVNFDLFEPNVIAERLPDGTLRYGTIDPERTFWGDRMADFMLFSMMLPGMEGCIAEYNRVAESPVTLGPEEAIRIAVMTGYIALIMEVERYYRYTPELPFWERAIAFSGMLFKNAFAVLEQDG